MKNKWIFLLFFLLLFSCYSKKNMTDERVKERIKEFTFLMAQDRFEEVEKLLSREMLDSENKEVFLSNFDNWQLKDTTDIIIEIQDIYIPSKNKKNRAMISLTIRSEKNDLTKIISMPMRYEKGDWYIGS